MTLSSYSGSGSRQGCKDRDVVGGGKGRGAQVDGVDRVDIFIGTR